MEQLHLWKKGKIHHSIRRIYERIAQPFVKPAACTLLDTVLVCVLHINCTAQVALAGDGMSPNPRPFIMKIVTIKAEYFHLMKDPQTYKHTDNISSISVYARMNHFCTCFFFFVSLLSTFTVLEWTPSVEESGRTPGSKNQIQAFHRWVERASWRGTGRPNLSRETKFSGANGDSEKNTLPVQLTTSRIGNHTLLIHTPLKVLTMHNSNTSSATLGNFQALNGANLTSLSKSNQSINHSISGCLVAHAFTCRLLGQPRAIANESRGIEHLELAGSLITLTSYTPRC